MRLLGEGAVAAGVRFVRRALEEPARQSAGNSGIASLMLTTEAMISEIKEKDEAPAMPGGMGGMY